MLHVYCPFITEELWEKIGNKKFISNATWPIADTKKINKKLEMAEATAEKTVEDIKNILRILEERKEKATKAYVYVMPFEKEYFDEQKMSLRVGKPVKVFSVNDKNKYDPTNKAKKSKPGKPAVYIE